MNRIVTFELRRMASASMPRSLGRLPYSLALATIRSMVQMRLRTRSPRIWARHSFLDSAAFVPFVSDLDLTCWFDSAPDIATVEKTLQIRSRLARWMPWLGEINLYAAGEARAFAPFANPLELARDPRTLELLPGARRSADSAERSVFILRGIESDVRHLLMHPEVRTPKWRSHLSAIGHELEGAPDLVRLTQLAVRLSEWGTQDEQAAAVRSLVEYFKLRAAGVHFPDIATDPYRWIFLPYRFCFKPEAPPRLKDPAASIARAQMGWEIWGLLGQIRNALFWAPESREGIGIHLETLERYTKSALPPEVAHVGGQDLLPALERLSQLYRELRAQHQLNFMS